MKPPTRGFGIGRPRRATLGAALRRAQLLKGLDDLHRNGLLTDEEYQEKRAKLLGGDQPQP
jgi:hypothetical protein